MIETFPHTVARLLTALESLNGAETVLLAHEAWSDVAAVQERSAGIVRHLVELLAEPDAVDQLDPAVHDRASALIQAQEVKIHTLSRKRAVIAEELRSLHKSQQNVRTFLPAYRSPGSSNPRLSFTGEA